MVRDIKCDNPRGQSVNIVGIDMIYKSRCMIGDSSKFSYYWYRSYQGISLFAGVNDTSKGQYSYHPLYTYHICLD